MTRERMAVIYCDGDDGSCGDWTQDYDAMCVSKVGGVPITREQPAPGWTHTSKDGWEADLCPDHAPAGGDA